MAAAFVPCIWKVSQKCPVCIKSQIKLLLLEKESHLSGKDKQTKTKTPPHVYEVLCTDMLSTTRSLLCSGKKTFCLSTNYKVSQIKELCEGSVLQCSESRLEIKGTHTLVFGEASRQHAASSKGFVSIAHLCHCENYLKMERPGCGPMLYGAVLLGWGGL